MRKKFREGKKKKKKKKKDHTFFIFFFAQFGTVKRKKRKKRGGRRRYADRQRGDLMGKLLPNTLPRDRIVTSNKSGFCDN